MAIFVTYFNNGVIIDTCLRKGVKWMQANSLFKDIKMRLIESDIRPTYQRIKILEYLDENRTHPTADDIYSALAPSIPTLSKTTVYNTLSTFKDAGLVNELRINGMETRFDIILKPHGHFTCVECGELSDFNYNIESIDTNDLSDYKILNKSFIVEGICPKCLKAKSKNNN